jgi:outer membrane protein assembly factor BamB
MKMKYFTLTSAFGLSLVLCCCGADWVQFRGSPVGGLAVDTDLPVQWNDGENLAWRIDLPGRGPSSPIVVGERILLTATTGFREDRLHVLCFDAATGDQLWERRFWATGRTATHDSITGAAPTPASDGRYVYAFYSSNDLICLDLDGNLRWYRGLTYDYPKAGNDVGMASSPVVVDGVVVVQVENKSDSFAAGIDAATGETRWRLPRAQDSNWASPIVLPGQGGRRTAVLLQSGDVLTAHDPQTGEQLWRFDDGCATVASSVYHDGLLFTPMNGLTALRLSDQSNAVEVAWDSNRMRPGSASPIVHDGRVYVLSNATVRCGDGETGDLLWSVRLKGRHWATPVIAGGHLYCTNQDGVVRVVKLGDQEGEIVGETELGETIHASPAVAGDAMYIRSDKHLWKIAYPR